MNDGSPNYVVNSVGNSVKKFRSSFYLDSKFYGIIIGSKGSTLSELQNKSNVRIRIPRQGEDSEIVIVTGNTYNDVIACRKNIDHIVNESEKRKTKNLTHFISFPLSTKETSENFEKLINEIKEDTSIRVNPKVFHAPAKLHQTVAVMALLNEEDVTKAIECLKDCRETVIKPFLEKIDGNLTLELKGVDIMNDDPSKVKTLFAKIESEEFQELCNQIMNFFVNRKISFEHHHHKKVKIHISLTDRKTKFDARRILEKYGDYYFGLVEIKEIHLSQMHTDAANGYYEASTVLEI